MLNTWFDQFDKRSIRILTLIFILLGWLFAEVFSGWQMIHSAFWLIAFCFSVIFAWFTGDLVVSLRNQRMFKQQIEEHASHNREIQRRLESMIHLNRQLIEVEDEQGLVEKALGIISDLTGALASSYVPLDEMGEPLIRDCPGKPAGADFKSLV